MNLMRRFGLYVLVVLFSASILLTGCLDTHSSAPVHRSGATLIVTTNIPTNAPPQILIFGPDGYYYQSTGDQEVKLSDLKPGIYKLVAFGLVDDGKIYMPQFNAVLLRLKEGKKTVLSLKYEESGEASIEPIEDIIVINANDVLDVKEDYVDLSADYSSSNLDAGQVIVSGPLPAYENGFLREILDTSKTSRALRVYTRDVDFAAAFPDAKIRLGKMVNDYEVAAALAVYDPEQQSFNLDMVYKVFSVESDLHAMATTNVPIIGPEDRYAPLESYDGGQFVSFDKEVCVSDSPYPYIRNNIYVTGLDPCVYAKGKFYIDTSIGVQDGIPVYSMAVVYASWAFLADAEDEPAYDGPEFGFKIRTHSYKEKYEGDLKLPDIPISIIPLYVSGIPITVSASIQPRVHAGLQVSGQGAKVLKEGFTLLRYFTKLQGNVSVSGTLFGGDDTRIRPKVTIRNNLRFTKPKYEFFTDADGEKLSSFKVSGDLRAQLELHLGVYDTPKRNVGGFIFVGFGRQLDVSADALCETDPWWSVDFGSFVTVGVNFEALHRDYGRKSKDFSLGSNNYHADPIFTVSPTNFSLVKGEVTSLMLNVNGPKHCVGNIMHPSFNSEELVRFLPDTIELSSDVSDMWVSYKSLVPFKALDDAEAGSYTVTLRVEGDRGDILAPFVREVPLSIDISSRVGYRLVLTNAEVTAVQGRAKVKLYVTAPDGFRGQVELALKDAMGQKVNGITILPRKVNVEGRVNSSEITFFVSSRIQPGTYKYYLWGTAMVDGRVLKKVVPIILHVN